MFSNTLSFLSSRNVSDQVSHPYKTRGKIIVLYILIFKFLDSNLEDKRFCTEWWQAFPDLSLLLISSGIEFLFLKLQDYIVGLTFWKKYKMSLHLLPIHDIWSQILLKFFVYFTVHWALPSPVSLCFDLYFFSSFDDKAIKAKYLNEVCLHMSNQTRMSKTSSTQKTGSLFLSSKTKPPALVFVNCR